MLEIHRSHWSVLPLQVSVEFWNQPGLFTTAHHSLHPFIHRLIDRVLYRARLMLEKWHGDKWSASRPTSREKLRINSTLHRFCHLPSTSLCPSCLLLLIDTAWDQWGNISSVSSVRDGKRKHRSLHKTSLLSILGSALMRRSGFIKLKWKIRYPSNLMKNSVVNKRERKILKEKPHKPLTGVIKTWNRRETQPWAPLTSLYPVATLNCSRC